ncbi:MAG: SNF2-related protein [bacterium]|nr:SNF2-related protein [bacterium]
MRLFELGDRVLRLSDGEIGVVVSFDKYLGYQVAFRSGLEHVGGSAIELLPLEPEQALLTGEFSSVELYGLRVQALYLQHAYRYDTLAGLSNARIEPTFHQIMVALQVLAKSRPRMILADEVGLGKTIEAGLILKELRARRVVDRVLIVVPASLQWQWEQELRSKFNEHFEVLDGAALKSLARRGGNPWRKHGNVICSLSLARREVHAEQIVEAGWDLVIFDEAHRVRRSLHGKRVTSTLGYQLADKLKEGVDGMLLLTATPMQLHPYELYSLIELVEPGICDSFEEYERDRQDLPRLAGIAKDVQQWDVLDTDRRESLLRFFSSYDLDVHANDDRDAALRVLDRQHPFARTMIRNRKSDIGGFTQRCPELVVVEMDLEEKELYEDVSGYLHEQYNMAQAKNQRAIGFLMVTYLKMLSSSSNAVRAALRRRITKLTAELGVDRAGDIKNGEQFDAWPDPRELSSEIEGSEHRSVSTDSSKIRTEITVLQDLVGRLGKARDSKASQLLLTLRRDIQPDEKVIIFTQFLETQAFLRKMLDFHGYEVEVFNGSMSQEEKDKAVIRFRERSQILVATEAGGEGRNFQFTHILFNYDLPWNPMKIEQRIGRMDRIGQKHDIYIYNFACKGTIEEKILDVLNKRIRLFEESVGSLDPILGELEGDIKRLAFDGGADTTRELALLESDLERKVREARELENEKKYLALDPAIFRQGQANRLVEQRIMAGPSDLQNYVDAALRYFGGRVAEHSDGGVGIYLSPDLQRRLGAKNGSYRGVFDYREALQREDLEFFALGQSLIDSIVELPMGTQPAVACRRRGEELQGGPHIEIFYTIESDGPVRFGQFVRHLVGEDLHVEETKVTEMPEIGEPSPRCDLPSWAESAFEASKLKLAARQERSRSRVQDLHTEWYEEELDRTRRIYEDRDRRLRQEIEDYSARIDRLEATGTPQEKRILPAIRGRLNKARTRLSSDKEDHDAKLIELQEQKSDVSVRIRAAALVVGD